MAPASREAVNRVAEAMGACHKVLPKFTPDMAVEPADTAQDGIAAVDQEMQQRWNQTVCKELQIPESYQKAAVLMVHWAEHLDKDLNCAAEVQELKTLFKDGFNYHCEDVVTLDTKKRPQTQLDHAISKFVMEHDGSHRQNLLVVYYSGHGFFKEGTDLDSGHLCVSGTTGPEEEVNDNTYLPEAQWDQAEITLRKAEADVLVILDCCFAGSAMKGSRRDLRAFQLLAAVGPDDLAFEPGQRSYTRKLIDALKCQLQKNDKSPFSTYDLNQEINRLKNWKSKAQVYNRMAGCTRPIRLAPVKPEAAAAKQGLVPTGSVDLRLTFSNHQGQDLLPGQIDKLAKNIAIAVKKSKINACSIDWIKNERFKKKSRWDETVGCTQAAQRWLSLHRKRKRSRGEEGNADDCEDADSPSRKRLSVETVSVIDESPSTEDKSPWH